MQIVDIDFRFAVPDKTTTNPPVLQWRKKVPIPSEETKHMPVPYITGYEWTEWQDVRTEEE